MAEQRPDPFSDLISLVAGPIAAVVRSFDQLRKGSEELMRGLENFNTTMESLNETAGRINRLLNEFEEPIRALMPQVTRTIQTADDLTSRLSGPVDQVVPGLARLADTLNSPVFTALPTDLGTFLDAINELVRRLAPLSQLAESAGGMFGIKLPGMSRPAAPTAAAPPPATVPAPDPEPEAAAAEATKRAPAKKAGAKKSPAKKRAARRAPSA